MIGDSLAHFRITAKLGEGGMGVVYQARDTRLGRDVAIKVLPAEFVEDAARLRRFRREARLLAAVSHPGIATIYEIGEHGEQTFLVMELVTGRTLAEAIRGGGLPPGELLSLARSLTAAVAAAHERGITHRDLKPTNVMLTPDDGVRVLDFGLARESIAESAPEAETLSGQELTDRGSALGTLPYMAPEQVRGERAGPRADVFAIGVVLFESAAGRRPFVGGSNAELASAILRDPAPELTRLASGLPSGFAAIVTRCLEKDPGRRFPSARELHDEIAAISAAAGTRGAAAGARSGIISSLAVLPLLDLSPGPPEKYFSEGVAEALITDLAKIGGFRVISRASSGQYLDTDKSDAVIGRELGVDALFHGSVQRAGERVRINARLVATEGEELLWAERYDRSLEDVLALQAEVAAAIAREVGSTLGSEPVQASRRKVDPEVYLLELQGRHHLYKRTEDGFRTAMTIFRRAVDLDPTHAPAWVGLADAYSMLANYGHVSAAEVHSHARAAIDRAIELGEASADVHRVLAFIQWQFEFDWLEAIREYECALEIEPNSAITAHWFGAYLSVIGFFDRGQEVLALAASLDPLSLLIPSLQGWAYYFARDHETAVRYLRRVVAIDPSYFIAQWFLGEALVELEEFEEGVAALERGVECSGGASRVMGYLGYAYGRAGRREDAQRVLAELDERARESYVPPYFHALVWSGMGDAEKTLETLERAYEARDTMIRDLLVDAQWDWLRETDRFQTLFDKMGYPAPA
jgi:TolB-like protein/Tfp pilus assembly protein PilF/predicted Ser/Thr protein kinase